MTGVVIDRLSGEDTRVLKLGRGAIRGHTCKLIVLGRSGGQPLPTLDALRRHVAARLDSAPRFRQRVVQTPLGVANPVWLDDADFEISRHVTRIPTSGAVGRHQLAQIVARRMEQRLDRSHPLWHLDVVEQVEPDGMALIWRVHHCLADGTTAVRLASSLLWDSDAASGQTSVTWQPHAGPKAITLLGRGLADRARTVAHAVRQRPGGSSVPTLKGTVSRELRRSASVTSLAGRVGSARSVALAQAPLDPCRRAGKAIDGSVTVNDVVLSIIAGGVRTWLRETRTPGDAIRVKVPVSLHQPDEGAGVSNRNSYFFVDLPVAEADPAKRILAITRETRERKLGHDAETLYRLGRHPFVARWAMSPRVFTFNVSNVPGPRDDVFVLGARVRELYSLAEIARHHALRVAVISAAGSLSFGLCADRDAVQNLDGLADGLRRATEDLLQLAGGWHEV